jgi:hypothetical protein
LQALAVFKVKEEMVGHTQASGTRSILQTFPGPTFGPFCNIHMLLVVTEDLDFIMSKGDML